MLEPTLRSYSQVGGASGSCSGGPAGQPTDRASPERFTMHSDATDDHMSDFECSTSDGAEAFKAGLGDASAPSEEEQEMMQQQEAVAASNVVPDKSHGLNT